MDFPAELIELVAEYLPNHQQYKCLSLSRNWFKSVHRAMYKVIYIKNRHQFKLFLQIIEKKGHLVRQVYFTKCKSATTIPPQWIYYIARKYPQMQEFDIEALDSATTAFHTYKKAVYSPLQPAIPSAKEIHTLFSVLISSCPGLRKLQIDSVTGRRYMTGAFFDTLATHNHLKEIKLKQSTYNLVSRDQFFDLLVTRGQQVISGLGTEVIGTDLHISNILDPLSHFTRLTELVLCCGHPYFDCDCSVDAGSCLTSPSDLLTSCYTKVKTIMHIL
ncbi:hypothetical protein BD408DRAFT_407329 [Parasitella parasitica]|nr:hypothetical protein BD408DRAFT_407329 [Parasitella parasitica]